jgi:hypothetical protein
VLLVLVLKLVLGRSLQLLQLLQLLLALCIL